MADQVIHYLIIHTQRLYFNGIMKREEKIRIRAYIKARVALHISPKEIFSELCRIHGSTAVTLRTVFRWIKTFQWGQRSFKDSNRPGRPLVAATKKNIDAVGRMA